MQRLPLAIAALLVSLGISCAKRDEPAPHVPFIGKPTAALIQRPEVAALVDDLAKEKMLESSHIGAGGVPSDVYKKFAAIVAKADEGELAALLEHESAVVRGYAAKHIAYKVGSRVNALVPLADDPTSVATLNGCIGMQNAMGSIVREALCSSELPEAAGALIAIAEKGGQEASAALACAAPISPTPASGLALRALRKRPRIEDEVKYLRVLGMAPAPDPSEGCALARKRAGSEDENVQMAVAEALWHCNDEDSKEVLGDLAGKTNYKVKAEANVSLFLMDEARRAELDTSDYTLARVAARLEDTLRSPEGTKANLALCETLALAYPAHLGWPFHRAIVTPETTQAALRIAAKVEPSKPYTHHNVRDGVIEYLARAKEPAAAAEFRRSLEGSCTEEITNALQGLEALKDTASRAAVEKLTKHPNAEVAKAAEKTLGAL